MCARFTQTSWSHDWRAFYDVADFPDFRPGWNVAPTRKIAAIRVDAGGERMLVGLRWGLIPSWAKDKKIGSACINARAETVATKPAFRTAFKRRRCIIPMDGYYEWRTEAGAKHPYLVQGAEPLAVAGLWERWTDPATDEILETCTVITTESAPDLRALQDRMPVILAGEKQRRQWLDLATPAEVLGQLLLPLEGLHYRPVSKRVNKVGNDGADLLEADPVATAE